MQTPQSMASWEVIRQIALAIVFFTFVLTAFHNGMSKSDIMMWLGLAGTSGIVSWVKATISPQVPAAECQPVEEK